MSKQWPWLLPIIFVILIAPFTPWLDLTISSWFYTPSKGFQINKFNSFIYNWATMPAMIVGIASAIAWCVSWYIPEWKKWRRTSLYLALVMLVGAELIVHVVLKDHWGRPRPVQVIQFGGAQEFRPFYKPNFFEQPEPSKGFTCGHCTMGFYFFALALAGQKLKNWEMEKWGWILTIVLGGLLSYVRIAQGGHFFSDILFSALIMWLVAYWLNRWIPEYERS